MQTHTLYTSFLMLALVQACGNTEFKKGQSPVTKTKSQDASALSTATDTGTDTDVNTLEGGPSSKIKKPAPQNVAECTSKDNLVDEGQSVEVNFSKAKADETYEVLLENKTAGPGTVEKTATVGKVIFRAPATIAKDTFVFIKAKSSANDDTKFCRIGIAKAGSLAIDFGASGRLRLPVAQVYQLPDQTKNLPDFSKMTPVQALKFKDIYVPRRDFRQGFPGISTLTEYFGIQYKFNLTIPVAGSYQFYISSDDGSRLYINNSLVLDLDSWAWDIATHWRTGAVTLAAGTIVGRVDYFQGPGTGLGLELKWKKPGDSDFVPIPPSAFSP